MDTRRALRGLLTVAGLLLVAVLSGALTWGLRVRPWQRTVPFRPDPVAQAEDVALVWQSASALPAGSGLGPDIVLIVLDTVRADHLELYGYPHSTMPRLATWAEQAQVFEEVRSTSSWTLPAHASLFTGLYPSTHGAHGRLVGEDHKRRFRSGLSSERVLERPLDGDAVTVAERLWDAGYTTMGIAANRAFLDRTWQLEQGFDLWICEEATKDSSFLPYTRADRVTAMALEAMDSVLPQLAFPEQPGRAPIFLFLNYMEAHAPYVPREGYVRDPDKLVLRHRSGGSRERLAQRVLAGEEDLPEVVRAGWIEAYDAELRFLDEQLASLLEGLEARGIGRDAVIFVVSDHGEYLGEHRLVEHSKDLYEPGIGIPLIVRGPGLEPGRRSGPIQLQDLAPWLVALGGAQPLPGAEPTGALQVAELYGSRMRDLRNPKTKRRFNRVRRSFQQGDHKVILGSDGSFEAFDLADDPDESRDRSGERWAQELAVLAQAWMEQHGVDDAAPMEDDREEPDAANLEALRSLGYLD
jgi:arylsulfatase A-like enzyme